MPQKVNPQQIDQYVSISKASTLLSVSRGTIYNLLKKGAFRKYKVNYATRLKASEIKNFMDNQHSIK